MMPVRTRATPSGCCIRALWVINNQDSVIFSRKFAVVEKRWRLACEKESDYLRYRTLPNDSEVAASFVERKKREGSARGTGIRSFGSSKGSDSWVDDPITRHVICLFISGVENGDSSVLWPLVLNMKGPYSILVLPLVETYHLETYLRMCNTPGCGSAVGADESMSSLLLDLPSITGAFAIAHTIGDIVLGDSMEPEVVFSTSSVGGLLDSLTGGIPGMSARTKPVAVPTTALSASGNAVRGSVMSDAPKTSSRSFDKDLLRSFISSAMPFGSPLDLNFSNISAMRTSGFSSADIPPADRKQPAWKPYLYRGKQRILFTIHERVNAAMYDRDEIPDRISISGQVNCRAELEGLPDVSIPFTGLDSSHVESLSFHPCAQVPEHGDEKQMITFSPPSGNFILMRYQSLCSLGPPIKGFYQLSMVSENEGAFLFKLSLMGSYKSPVTIEFCTVTMPFPRRRVVSFEGTPSIGSVSSTDHSVEWKVITNPRSLSGKSVEANFPGTVRFAQWQAQTSSSIGSRFRAMIDEASDSETESTSNASVEDYIMEKMNKDLLAADLDEPFCWKAYNYAKVSFRMTGSSLSGMSVNPKSVNIFPSVKAPVEVSNVAASGDYILWNTLGRCPVAATH